MENWKCAKRGRQKPSCMAGCTHVLGRAWGWLTWRLVQPTKVQTIQWPSWAGQPKIAGEACPLTVKDWQRQRASNKHRKKNENQSSVDSGHSCHWAGLWGAAISLGHHVHYYIMASVIIFEVLLPPTPTPTTPPLVSPWWLLDAVGGVKAGHLSDLHGLHQPDTVNSITPSCRPDLSPPDASYCVLFPGGAEPPGGVMNDVLRQLLLLQPPFNPKQTLWSPPKRVEHEQHARMQMENSQQVSQCKFDWNSKHALVMTC